MPQLEEPMFRILTAQAKNLARMGSGVIMPGTTGQGENITLWGPAPDVIRLYDRPLRFIEGNALDNWERIITLAPVVDSPAGRVTGRNDRNFRYQIHFFVRLLDSEQAADRSAVLTGNRDASNPLAVKAHRLIYDFHHTFFDNIHLTGDDLCPTGLVDDADYTMAWDAGTEYPNTLFVADVSGSRSAW